MVKSSSFDSSLAKKSILASKCDKNAVTLELEKKNNPFVFDADVKSGQSAEPIKPPRHNHPGTSRLGLENNGSSGSITRPKLDRQISDNKAIKKIQA